MPIPITAHPPLHHNPPRRNPLRLLGPFHRGHIPYSAPFAGTLSRRSSPPTLSEPNPGVNSHPPTSQETQSSHKILAATPHPQLRNHTRPIKPPQPGYRVQKPMKPHHIRRTHHILWIPLDSSVQFRIGYQRRQFTQGVFRETAGLVVGRPYVYRPKSGENSMLVCSRRCGVRSNLGRPGINFQFCLMLTLDKRRGHATV
ncbi:hypothetical protein B0T18DRAFT_397076 [Schizothecium vesticola]|uniref:Uncharacterized protein n=1 Tax=Schizothecium vesticola TaxID=314040 RepID=A0AA40F9D5_9PEZI|nr:hypothetical protein B0T18DRAFT_397076 [Schizothecium vesticola]